MAHAPTRDVIHFAFLEMILRIGEQVMITRMIVVHVRDDSRLDRLGSNSNSLQARRNWLGYCALSF
jgi:hypothetical protein